MSGDADVIVVGAGFTGLSAALELQRAGLTVLVLEARNRVGGRVESAVNALGERIDTGGQFYCDDMPNVVALMAERGHVPYSPPFAGAGTSIPPLSQATLARVGATAMALRERYLAIDPREPSIEGLTIAAWLDRQPEDPGEKAAFRSMIEGLWCHALEDVPLWFMIENDRRITNEQYELQHYPAGTMHALAEDLAGDLGRSLRLSTPVFSLATSSDDVEVDVGTQRLAARAALVAVPPSMAARLAFAPALPGVLNEALSAWRPGAVIKLVLRYERAFWRDAGLSGEVLWRDPVGLYACDTGHPGRPTLSAFIGGPAALEWRRRGLDVVLRDMLAQLATVLGPQASTPLDAVIRDWSLDPWSGGAYSDLILDMGARDVETVIAAGAPPLHFASSEISPSFPGYVEGAIVAGRLAAQRIVEELCGRK